MNISIDRNRKFGLDGSHRNIGGDKRMLARNKLASIAGLISHVTGMSLHATRGDAAKLLTDAKQLCDYVNSGGGGSICKAELSADADGKIVAGLMFDWLPDSDEKPIPENPRRFDILFFAALVLMTAAGARIYFHDPKRKGRLEYYLRMGPYAQPDAGDRIYVARIIRNTPAGTATPFAIDHHSYRYIHLDQAPPHNNLPPPSVGRPEAIALVQKVFEKAHPAGLDGITGDEIEKVLTRLLEAATEYHGQREG
jgi:hypothetical protein